MLFEAQGSFGFWLGGLLNPPSIPLWCCPWPCFTHFCPHSRWIPTSMLTASCQFCSPLPCLPPALLTFDLIQEESQQICWLSPTSFAPPQLNPSITPFFTHFCPDSRGIPTSMLAASRQFCSLSYISERCCLTVATCKYIERNTKLKMKRSRCILPHYSFINLQPPDLHQEWRCWTTCSYAVINIYLEPIIVKSPWFTSFTITLGLGQDLPPRSNITISFSVAF